MYPFYVNVSQSNLLRQFDWERGNFHVKFSAHKFLSAGLSFSERKNKIIYWKQVSVVIASRSRTYEILLTTPTFLFGFLSAPGHLSPPKTIASFPATSLTQSLISLWVIYFYYFVCTLSRHSRRKGKSPLRFVAKTKINSQIAHAREQLQLHKNPSPSETFIFLLHHRKIQLFLLLALPVEIYSVNRFLQLIFRLKGSSSRLKR